MIQKIGETAKIEVCNCEPHLSEKWSEVVECGWFFGPDCKHQAELFIEKLKNGTAFKGQTADDRDFRVVVW